MEDYIQITKLNDFIFCPKSLYFHEIFGSFSSETYQSDVQTVGKIKHEAVDQGTYSTSKHVLQGTYVYSDRLMLCGKIDTFDIKSGVLTERKYQVKQIYLGFKYQLYAQMFCLEEMGYRVKKLKIYSVRDNKLYDISLPDAEETVAFENLIKRVRLFNPLRENISVSEEKCKNCIYKSLCH